MGERCLSSFVLAADNGKGTVEIFPESLKLMPPNGLEQARLAAIKGANMNPNERFLNGYFFIR